MQSNSISDVVANDVLAEETHTGRVWAVIILAAMLGPGISVAMIPAAPARFALLLVGVVGIGVFLMPWMGFQYRFSRHGVEISMLGFHLRTIPKMQIVSYSVEPWSFVRGFGIRGIGSSRAYTWGMKVVHIKTTNGEVYLGHSDPERIIQDLNLVTGNITRG